VRARSDAAIDDLLCGEYRDTFAYARVRNELPDADLGAARCFACWLRVCVGQEGVDVGAPSRLRLDASIVAHQQDRPVKAVRIVDHRAWTKIGDGKRGYVV
jgi:hypothetical protein